MPCNRMVRHTLSTVPRRQRFTIQISQDEIKRKLNHSNSSGRLTRWVLRLSELYLDVLHNTGIKHQAAAALLGLSSIIRVKTSFKEGLSFLTIDFVMETITSNLGKMVKICRITIIDTAEASSHKPMYDTSSHVELILAQMHDVFCQTATTYSKYAMPIANLA